MVIAENEDFTLEEWTSPTNKCKPTGCEQPSVTLQRMSYSVWLNFPNSFDPGTACSLMKTVLASFTVGDFLIADLHSSNNPSSPSSSRVYMEPAETLTETLTLTNASFWSPEVVWIYHIHIKIKHKVREALIKPYQTQTWQDYDLSIKLPEELWFNILVRNPLFISLYRTENREHFPPLLPSSVLFYLSAWAGKSVSASPMKTGDRNCSVS